MLNYKGILKEGQKGLYTQQGKYIVYIIVICSIIGIVIQYPIGSALKNHEMSLKGSNLNQIEEQTMEERAILISMVVTVFLLIVLILSMRRIIRIVERRRTRNSDEEEH